MQFKSVLLILASVSSIMASPLEIEKRITAAEPVEIDTRSDGVCQCNPAGNVFGYGKVVCNDKVCDAQNKNNAPYSLCTDLVAKVNSVLDQVLDHTKKYVCVQDPSTKSNECCITWSDSLPTTATYRDIKPYLDYLTDNCSTNGVTGRWRYSTILGTCNSFCVSSRMSCGGK